MAAPRFFSCFIFILFSIFFLACQSHDDSADGDDSDDDSALPDDDLGDDDVVDDELDDDAVDDDMTDDDSADDDTADDDIVDDDSVDDDTTDDDGADDDTADDDTVDDDSTDDDGVDDDSLDDDSADDDTVDDDSIDDDVTPLEDLLIEKVDGGAVGSTDLTIKSTSDGTIHVAAVDGPDVVLFHQSAGKGWTRELLAAFAAYPDLAVGPNDTLYVSYQDLAQTSLVVADNSNGSWNLETVEDLEGYVYTSTSVAVDPDGFVHLAFDREDESYDHHLMYATNRAGGWEFTTIAHSNYIPTFAGWKGWLAVDAAGSAHISYSDYFGGEYSNLIYTTNRTGEWELECLDHGWHDPQAQYYITYIAGPIVVEPTGAAHILSDYTYYVDGGSGNELHYHTNREGTWAMETINGGYHWGSSMTIDGEGFGHAAYSGGWTLGYANNLTGVWLTYGPAEFECVDSAIALDPTGGVHIAGYDDEHGILKHVSGAGDEWYSDVIAESRLLYSFTTDPAIGADAAGHLYLAYLDPSSDELVLATNATGAWLISVVDTVHVVTWPVEMAVAADGTVHLVWMEDIQGGQLRYGTNQGGDWALQTIDNEVYLEPPPAIALDQEGMAHIFYNKDEVTWHVYNASATWFFEEALGFTTYNLRAVMDAFDRPHLAFGHNGGPDGIWYATKDGDSWNVEQVTWMMAYGDFIALDQDQNVLISYSTSDYKIRLASNTGGEWNSQVVASRYQGNEWQTILAVDAAGHVHLGFAGYDGPDFGATYGLRYSTNMSGDWKSFFVQSGNASTYGSGLDMTLDGSGFVHMAYLGYYSVWHARFPLGGGR